MAGLLAFSTLMAAESPGAGTDAPLDLVARARSVFQEAQARHEQTPADVARAWEFGRACFDLAEFATNRVERAELAESGMAACRQAIAGQSNSAPAHYYFAMNLAQLARTRGWGALKLVHEMRREFELVGELDGRLDYAGAERNLGLLYRDAPSVVSIGNRKEARHHLERAAKLVPEYPENGLNLAESLLKWGDKADARRELKTLETAWSAARTRFNAPERALDWADWEARLKVLQKKLAEGK